MCSRDRGHRAARWPDIVENDSIDRRENIPPRFLSISSSSAKLPSSAAIGLTCTPKAEHSSTSSSVCTTRRLWTMIFEPNPGHCQSDPDGLIPGGKMPVTSVHLPRTSIFRRFFAACQLFNPKPLNTVNNIIAPIKTGDGDVPQPHFEKLSIHVFVFSYGDDNGGVLPNLLNSAGERHLFPKNSRPHFSDALSQTKSGSRPSDSTSCL